MKNFRKRILSLLRIFALVVIFLFTSCSRIDQIVNAISQVKFEPNGGEVSKDQKITLTCDTQDTEIYYSSKRLYSINYKGDGTKLDESGSFSISEFSSSSSSSLTLYAIAVDSSGRVSKASSATFVISSSSSTSDDSGKTSDDSGKTSDDSGGTSGSESGKTETGGGETPTAPTTPTTPGGTTGGQGSGIDNSPLLLGNPTNATKDSSNKINYLMEKTTYTISYNDTTHTPNWVAWHLDSSDCSSKISRSDDFREDSDLPSGFYKVGANDFKNSDAGYWFSRGHMCPSADRTSSSAKNSETFLMTNMVPQNQKNNGGPWGKLESAERTFATSGRECYIISGPAGKGGTNAKSVAMDYIPITNPYNSSDPGIQVPASVWKIILVLDEGDNDLSRITESTTVIAVNMPNRQDIGSNWTDYIVTVDELETLTGYDFFSALDQDLQKALQSKKYSN